MTYLHECDPDERSIQRNDALTALADEKMADLENFRNVIYSGFFATKFADTLAKSGFRLWQSKSSEEWKNIAFDLNTAWREHFIAEAEDDLRRAEADARLQVDS